MLSRKSAPAGIKNEYGTRLPMIDFNYLSQQEEGEKFDFKRQLNISDDREKSKFIKDIISMANTLGDDPSFILIGVDNEGPRTFVGVTTHPDDATLQEIVKAKVSPVPRFSYRRLSSSDKSFGLIRVESDHRLHQATQDYGVLRKNTIYLRRGSSNQEADAAEIEGLVHDKSSRAFSALLQGASVGARQSAVKSAIAGTMEAKMDIHWNNQRTQTFRFYAQCGPMAGGTLPTAAIRLLARSGR